VFYCDTPASLIESRAAHFTSDVMLFPQNIINSTCVLLCSLPDCLSVILTNKRVHKTAVISQITNSLQ